MTERPALRLSFELSGVVPLAVYAAVHVGTYAGALFGSTHFGVEAASGPAWLALELALVWLPLLFHGAYGLSRLSAALPSEPNERQRGALLRASGACSLPFLLGHAWWLRAPLLHGSRAPEDIAQMLASGLSTTVRGYPVSAALHILGIGAVALHLALGLGAFIEKWGFVARVPARRAASLFSLALFVAGSATVIEFATGSALPHLAP